MYVWEFEPHNLESVNVEKERDHTRKRIVEATLMEQKVAAKRRNVERLTYEDDTAWHKTNHMNGEKLREKKNMQSFERDVDAN